MASIYSSVVYIYVYSSIISVKCTVLGKYNIRIYGKFKVVNGKYMVNIRKNLRD